MPYKISGTLSDAAKIIIFKESDWSIESETVVSGSGSYEVDSLDTGSKTVIVRSNEGEMLGYGDISPISYEAPNDRGVFAGGHATVNIIDYIVISTLGNATNFGDLTFARTHTPGATSNSTNERGVWAGGYISPLDQNIIDYITISTPSNAINFGDLTYSRFAVAATSNGTNDRGVFGGGGSVDTIDYITISTPGDATNFGDMTIVTGASRGATSNLTNNRGVFAGGWILSAYTNIIDYITITSTGNATNFGDLTTKRNDVAGFSNGTSDRGVFCAGDGYSDNNVIDYITISSTGDAQDFGDLVVARYAAKATSNMTNNRGIIVGVTNAIDYITISTLANAQDFGDLTSVRHSLSATSNA